MYIGSHWASLEYALSEGDPSIAHHLNFQNHAWNICKDLAMKLLHLNSLCTITYDHAPQYLLPNSNSYPE